MLILSPRAVERLESYTPAWPLPKIFRMTKGGKLTEGIFEGETINTPSMLCVEDYIDALQLGEVDRRARRADRPRRRQLEGARRLGGANDWIDFLAKDAGDPLQHQRLPRVVDPAVQALPADAQAAFAKSGRGLLEKEGVGFDIGAYRDAPPGLRIWCGATVETADVEALTPWLDWAFAEAKAGLAKAA